MARNCSKMLLLLHRTIKRIDSCSCQWFPSPHPKRHHFGIWFSFPAWPTEWLRIVTRAPVSRDGSAKHDSAPVRSSCKIAGQTGCNRQLLVWPFSAAQREKTPNYILSFRDSIWRYLCFEYIHPLRDLQSSHSCSVRLIVEQTPKQSLDFGIICSASCETFIKAIIIFSVSLWGPQSKVMPVKQSQIH